MKILQISTYYLPHIGGIEQVTADFSNILAEAGNEVKIICFNDCFKTVVENYSGQDIYRVGYIFKIFSQALSINYFFVLKKLIMDFQPDVIHIHFPNPLIAFYLYLINPKCKITVHWHSDIVKQKKMRKIIEPFVLKLLNKANKIIATTRTYAENSDTISKYLDKVKIIPCIVNENFLINLSEFEKEELQKKRQIYKNKKIIFSVGVHRAYKGLNYLIDACRFLTDDYLVVIAGTGSQTNELKKISMNLNLMNVNFIGRISDVEKKIFFHLAETFAFPSITKNEAFGIALAEALCCGTPAVTFHIDGSGVNYVNQNNVTGIEVHEFNSQKFAEALMNAMKEKYGKNAQNWVVNNFTKSAIKDDVLHFFDI